MSRKIREKGIEKNKGKHLKKGIAGFVIVAVLVSLFGFRVSYINRKYPKVTVREEQMGESFFWQDFEVTVTGYQTMETTQIKQDVNPIGEELADGGFLIVAALEVKYNGEEESVKFPISNIKGQSQAWYNSSKYSMLLTLNGDSNCKKGEARTLYTAIGISPVQFSESDWKKHDKREYQLVFQTYPEFVYVKL